MSKNTCICCLRHRFVLLFLPFFFLYSYSFAQSNNEEVVSYTTSLSFLNILPDARSQAMGGLTVGTETDPYSIYTNFSKSVFSTNKHNYSLTYSPLFINLGIRDINYINVSYFYYGKSEQSFGIGIKHINYGNFDVSDFNANIINSVFSFGTAFELAYAKKFNKYFSASIDAKIINSSLATDVGINSANTRYIVAATGDIGIYYLKYIPRNGIKHTAGATLTNLGGRLTKVATGNSATNSNVVPAKLSFASGISKFFGYEHKIYVGIELSNILVPVIETATDDEDKPPQSGSYLSQIFGNGNLQRGWYYGLGVEYAYRDFLYLRSGYRHRRQLFGGGSFLATGIGLFFRQYNLGVDFSYNLPINYNNANSNINFNAIKISLFLELKQIKFTPESIRCANVF